jgi:hypothetical protein
MTRVSWLAKLRSLRGPIAGTPVMLVDSLFPLAIEFCCRLVRRCVLHGLTSQIDRDLGL